MDRLYITTLLNCGLGIKSELHKRQVSSNDAMQIVLRRPRWWSAREMFVAARVSGFAKAVLRKHV